MEYGVLKVDKHTLLVELTQATDIKESLDELAEITGLLGCEVEFDTLDSNKSHLSVIFLVVKFNKQKSHEIALLLTRSEAAKYPFYKGTFLDAKTFERTNARDFFEVMAEFWNSIQDILKEKVRDYDILIDMALKYKEPQWFYELTYKKKRLMSKVNPT